ncbi:MAG: aminopeptidase [Pseudomonadota bacterium]
MPDLPRSSWRALCLAVVCSLLPGCYYLQAASGQIGLLLDRQDLEALVADPATDETLRERLIRVRDARDFAHRQLLLPDNGSYTTYVELDREFVVWNVFAAPEFSLAPKQWCFPVAGCVAYRGHFDEGRARAEAARLADDGYDVHVGGVPAYSTLGRFRDPVLSSMFRSHPDDVVATIFHELAHQVAYAPDDTTFNESFATAVADIGMRRWFRHLGDAAALTSYRHRRDVRRAFLDAAMAARAELDALYTQTDDATSLRAAKTRVFAGLAGRYRDIAADLGLAEVPAAPASNAALIPFGSYHDLVAAFEELLLRCGGELRPFYLAVTALAELDDNDARRAALAGERSESTLPAACRAQAN